MNHLSSLGLLRALRDDRGGNFGVLFAVSAMMLLIAAGTAVDITRAYTDKSDVTNALDAAVLATARAISAGQCQSGAGTNGAAADAAAQQCLDRFLAANMANTPDQAAQAGIATTVHVDAVTNTISAKATLPYKAAFGVFGDAGRFPISSSASATYGNGKAEVAMTFDLTGSMQGSKLSSLKTAAKTGIQTLLQANANGETRVRIAEIPYAASVNVGPDLANYVWRDDGNADAVAPKLVKNGNGSAASEEDGSVSFGVKIGLGGVKISLNLGNGNGNAYGHNGNSKNGSVGEIAVGGSNGRYCATERKGPKQFSDDGPDSGLINLDGDVDPSSCPAARIVPLTSDADTLLEQVGNFMADGNTAGHIGIQWAWYMLSNKWAEYLPADAGASANDEKDLHKYLVIMTDGMFNTVYSGFKPKDENGYDVSPTSSNDARDLCSKIKADGIQIFAVGFGLNGGTAESTLKSCASPDAGGVRFFYNASDGTELLTIYKQIASAIQKLRLVS